MIVPNTLYSDVSKEQTFRALLANQYDDNSRKYRLVITNNGVPQSLTQPKTIRLIMKAEGEVEPYYDYPLTEAWEGGYPILTFTSSMLSKIGKVYFKFIIYEPDGTEVLSTRIQTLLIQETFTNRDGIISNDNYDFLTHLVNEAIAVKDNTLLKTDLVNNTSQTVPGVKALDAAMGNFIYDGLLFKGVSSNLNAELNRIKTESAVMHCYSADAAGVPEALSGTVNTFYFDATNVLQYASNASGNCYWRKRTGSTTTNWVKINSLSSITAVDVNGLLGTPNSTVSSQALINEVSNRVTTDLVSYDNLANNGTTQTPGVKALDANYGKTLTDYYDELKKSNYAVVNVKKFGAVGNAIYYDESTMSWYSDINKSLEPTDDSISIQNAIDYAISHNIDTIYFPDGHYYTKNKKFIIDADNLRFIGENNTEIISVGLPAGSSFITLISSITLRTYCYPRTPLVNISISGNYFINDPFILEEGGITGISFGYGGSTAGETIISPHIALYNVCVTHFNRGVALLSAYQSSAFNLNIMACDIGIMSIQNTGGNSVVPWHAHQCNIQACAMAVRANAVGFSSMHFIGGAFEYNRINYNGSTKIYFDHVRFEGDIRASCDNNLNAQYWFHFGGTQHCNAVFDNCLFLVIPNYTSNASYWIPNIIIGTATADAIMYYYSTSFDGTVSLALNNCDISVASSIAPSRFLTSNRKVDFSNINIQLNSSIHMCLSLEMNALHNYNTNGENEIIIPVSSNSQFICGFIQGISGNFSVVESMLIGSSYIDGSILSTGTITGGGKSYFSSTMNSGYNVVRLKFSTSGNIGGSVINII